MPLIELPTELIHQVASFLGHEDTSQTNWALTCRRMYAILISGILEGRLQYISLSVSYPPSRYSGHYNTMYLSLSSYDGRHDAKYEPFGGSYRMLGFYPGENIREFMCIQTIIARSKDLDEIHIRLGQRGTTLQKVAAIIGNAPPGRPLP
ncbi:hypothetical protein BDN70DRAFT_989750 [Pholiota conissans]|uniref:F-box domain-containing protein n=1 Tax=Pholiota conissans TaxID=109636 RepID=A0A9P6D5T4_9AGAR|nr:hypothetical protein BDN70DRAFT_989750 [Pholiota conissans]